MQVGISTVQEVKWSIYNSKTGSSTELRPVRITTVEAADAADASILTLTIEWTHGIFKTEEIERFTLVSTATGSDFLINRDGHIEEIFETDCDAGTMASAISLHISETV